MRSFYPNITAMMGGAATHFMWRPQLRDADDELVLEAAINGRAVAILTFNFRDFGAAPARFGVDLLTPTATLRRMKP